MFNSAPGFSKYATFYNDAKITVTSEDDNLILADKSLLDIDEDTSVTPETSNHEYLHPVNLEINTFNGSTSIPDQTTYKIKQMKNEALLLQYHRDFGYVLFKKLQIMAKKGIIPKHLALCLIPTCSACLCGMMTKRN